MIKRRDSSAAESQKESSLAGELRAAPLSVEEVIARFTGQWILMRVTAFDEGQIPSAGYVIAHSNSRKAITVAFIRDQGVKYPDADFALGPYYIFRANPRSRSGPEFDRAVEELVAQIRARIGATGAAGGL